MFASVRKLYYARNVGIVFAVTLLAAAIIVKNKSWRVATVIGTAIVITAAFAIQERLDGKLERYSTDFLDHPDPFLSSLVRKLPDYRRPHEGVPRLHVPMRVALGKPCQPGDVVVLISYYDSDHFAWHRYRVSIGSRSAEDFILMQTD